jgi:hypothetical protein
MFFITYNKTICVEDYFPVIRLAPRNFITMFNKKSNWLIFRLKAYTNCTLTND